jgi:predicted nucleotidyltransferase
MSIDVTIDMRDLVAGVLAQARYPVRSLLLIGSVAEGHANQTSDVDLIAIVARARDGFRMVERALEFHDRAVSILYLTETMLRRRLGRLDAVYRSGGHLTDGIATRITNAVVVYDADGVGASLVQAARRYTPSPETLREMFRIALGFLHDALGSRGARDYSTAVLMARAAAAVAVDCYLLDRGERNLKTKWHLRRLERMGATPILEQYRRVLGVPEPSQTQADAAIHEVERLLCAVLQVPSLDRHQASPLLEAASR